MSLCVMPRARIEHKQSTDSCSGSGVKARLAVNCECMHESNMFLL